MNKKLLQELKEKLEKEKESLERNLAVFAVKDPKLEGDWNTRIPSFDTGHTEEEQDEVEEYISRLPVEHSLELTLRDVNIALDKIKKNKYGLCENCKKKISEERLKVYPQARVCMKCK